MFAHTRDSKIARLEGFPAFAGCDRHELELIASLGDLVVLDAGTVLTEQGGSGSEAFILLEGTATVAGDGRMLATLGPGAVVGEIATLDHGRRTATVTTETPVEALVFDPRAFARLVDEVPAVTRHMLADVAARLRATRDGAASPQG